MSDHLDRMLFPEFYDLVRPPKARVKRKCIRCGTATIEMRVCNKCTKFVNKQSRMAQDGLRLKI